MQALARRHAPRSRDPASTLPGSAPAPRRRHGRKARRRKPGPLASGAAHARHAAMSRHGGDGKRVARCAQSKYAASANGKRGSVGKRSAKTAGAYKSTTKWCRSRADAPPPPNPQAIALAGHSSESSPPPLYRASLLHCLRVGLSGGTSQRVGMCPNHSRPPSVPATRAHAGKPPPPPPPPLTTAVLLAAATAAWLLSSSSKAAPISSPSSVVAAVMVAAAAANEP